MNQVFNNYGAKSNSELLFSFGFCLRPNTFDVVIVSLGYIYFTCITKPVDVLLLVSVGYIYVTYTIRSVHVLLLKDAPLVRILPPPEPVRRG